MAQSSRDRSIMLLHAGFVVGGLLMYLRSGGDEGTRLTGLTMVVFFGGLGVASWVFSRPRSPRVADLEPPRMLVGTPPDAHRWVVAGRDVGIVINQPRARMLAALAGCGAAIGCGALMLSAARASTGPGVVGLAVGGWVLIGSFSACGAIALAGLVRRRSLSLLPGGVLLRQAGGSAFAPWPALTDAGVFTVYDHPTAGLVLGPGARLTGLLGPMRPLQRAYFGCDVPLGRTDPFDTSSLARLLDGLRRDPELREQLSEPEAVAMVMDLAFGADEDAER